MSVISQNDNGTWNYGTQNYGSMKEAQEAERRERQRTYDFFCGKKSAPKTNDGGRTSILGWILLAGIIAIGVNFGLAGIVVAIVAVIVIAIMSGYKKGQRDFVNKTSEEAWQLFNQGNYTLALEKAEQVAEKNADAADLAGVLYLNGDGCDVNVEKAFRYFELGKDKNAEAKAYYALLLLNGDGCEQNVEAGRNELLNAAIVGKNTLALMRLGEFQISGEFGFEKNVEQGMRNLRIAADEGYPYAMYLAGYMQYFGKDGVPENKEKGLELLKGAAEKGSQYAIEILEQIGQ